MTFLTVMLAVAAGVFLGGGTVLALYETYSEVKYRKQIEEAEKKIKDHFGLVKPPPQELTDIVFESDFDLDDPNGDVH